MAEDVQVAPDKVPALTRAIAVLNVLSSSTGGVTLANLARALDAPKSSLLNIISALSAERLVERTMDGRYLIGVRFADIASAYLSTPPKLQSIGFLAQSIEQSFFRVEAEAIAEAARSIGAVVHVKRGGKSREAELQQIRDLIGLGVEAIIVDTAEPNRFGEAAEVLRRFRVPAVAVNGGAAGVDATVTTDNTQAGELVARHIGATLNGVGSVAIVGGDLAVANDDRLRGFLSAMREYPAIEIVGHVPGEPSRTTGLEGTRRLLQTHSDLDAIFGINDPTALGIVEALQEAKSRSLVWSVDGSAVVVDMIRAGQQIVATAAQDPRKLGQTAVRFAELLVAGRRLPANNWHVSTMLVTRDNVDQYDTWD